MGLELDGSVKEGDLGHLSLPLRRKYGSAAEPRWIRLSSGWLGVFFLGGGGGH